MCRATCALTRSSSASEAAFFAALLVACSCRCECHEHVSTRHARHKAQGTGELYCVD
jgi:hypothetical protein